MNLMHISNFEHKAKEYAKETIINEEKVKYFLDGVSWAFDAINSTIRNSGHPMASDSDNRMMMNWTVSDIKKAMKKLAEKQDNVEHE